MKDKYNRLCFLLILLAAIAVRITVIYTSCQTITSDNAIIGLMAKHILCGKFPAFFYGQPYLGSLEAFVLAPFIFLFGVSARTPSLGIIFISTLGIISAYFLGKEIKDKTLGLLAMLLAALPPAYMFWHGLAAYGGYPETFLFGNIVLLFALKIAKSTNKRLKTKYYLALGFISGLAFWTHLLILYYLVPTGLFLLFNEKKKFLFCRAAPSCLLAFLAGSLPFWIYNFSHHFRSFLLPPPGNHLEGLGHFWRTIPPLFTSGWIAPWLFCLLILVYTVSFIFFIMHYSKNKFVRSPGFLFLLLFISIVFFFSSSHMAYISCARYLIPLVTIVMISVAALVKYLNKRFYYLGLIPLLFVLSFNCIDTAKNYADDRKISFLKQRSFNKLIDFLEREELRTNYSIFLIAAKLTFLSNEQIITVDPAGEKYPPYETLVETSNRTAFIQQSRWLDPMLDMLCRNYTHKEINGWHIYYDLQPHKYSGQLIPPNKWTVLANYHQEDTSYSYDRNIDTQWSTIKPKSKGMFYQLDLGNNYNIYKIALFNYKHWQNTPYDMTLEISSNGQAWKTIDIPASPPPLFWSGPRVYWHFEDGRTELIFKPTRCRYIRIGQNGKDSVHPWEINEIFVWEYAEQRINNPEETNNIYNFLVNNNITTAYADFWLSAQINRLSAGRIKTVKPLNKLYPYRANTSRFVRWDQSTSFIVDKENASDFQEMANRVKLSPKIKEFSNYTCFYFPLSPRIPEILFWSGYGLLKTNRLLLPLPNNVPQVKRKVVFEEGFELLGYTTTMYNHTLKINYFWKIKKKPDNVFVFVHFVNNNSIIFQNDHPLLGHFLLDKTVQDGGIFRETYMIKNVPSGQYDIIIGLWYPDSNKRIKIVYPEKGEGKIKLGNIDIK